MLLQRALAMAMVRSMEHYNDPELTRALRVSREEQRTRQHATARSTDPNDDPEMTRALRASVEKQRTRHQTMASNKQMDASGAPKEALGQGRDPATITEEEKVA